MKAVAFANNDIAVAAWTFGGKLPNRAGRHRDLSPRFGNVCKSAGDARAHHSG
jgi:hypothetical protein